MWDSLLLPDGAIKFVKCVSISEETGKVEHFLNELPKIDCDSSDKIYDIKGHLILPGLQDAHIHVLMTGEVQYYLDLKECYSIDDMKSKIRIHRQLHPQLPWIVGVYWDQTFMGRYPTKWDLDEACSDVPVRTNAGNCNGFMLTLFIYTICSLRSSCGELVGISELPIPLHYTSEMFIQTLWLLVVR